MSEIRHRTVTTNGIQMRIAESGSDAAPLVLLCHGFPEGWYSWRHQLPALATAGYHAVAPDMRGYGGSEKPNDIRAYTQLHHVGDMVGVLDALGAQTATVVGHDWGAAVAWNAALLRPDRFTAMAALSVPWQPRGPAPPTQQMKALFGDQWFYFLYFQEPGRAEAELDADPETFLRAFLYSISGDAPADRLFKMMGGPKSGRMLEHLLQPDELPPWLTQEDLAAYAVEFARTGFRGGLNWYRCADLSWELMAAWQDARVRQPALFVAGDRDLIALMPGVVDAMKESVPGLRRTLILPGCGHWTQQERPHGVNAALLEFLRNLPEGAISEPIHASRGLSRQ